ncbi:hypothetical protein NCC49_003760 [Naganishia albida]|nr:hypothetical protein NCC49_003760 [Naganishia albida]
MPSEIDWTKVHPSNNPQFSHFPSRRSTVFSTKGLVASSQPLASQAGLEILNKGGNAADAAVATAAALNVTEPSCTGIGGDIFCLFYDAKANTVRGINGSGKSPQALTLEYLRSIGIKGREIPLTNLNSVTVPGAAAGWIKTVEEFGSGKLSMKEILDPAIRMAEEGVPTHELHANAWMRSVNLIKNASENHADMLLNGAHPVASEIMTFPNLAKTFRAVADEGHAGFYKGRIAQAIVDLVQAGGGVMTMDDLAGQDAQVIEPICYEFKKGTAGADGVTLWECPPNGQGLTALVALGIIEQLENLGKLDDILKLEHNSVEYLHVLIESLRLAFADTRYYVTDPDVVHVPVKEMLSPEYLQERAGIFQAEKATADVKHGSPVQSSDTVYFTTSDSQGNACSFIASNYAGFGTGAIPKGCGFTLQNRGSCFTLQEGHPNNVQGGKRPYHTIIPAMVTRGSDRELLMSYGVMGGFMQPQGHVQVLLNVLRGMTPQAALDAPRFCISAGLPDADTEDAAANAGNIDSEVWMEEGISDEVVQKLRDMGHDARKASSFNRSIVGRGQIIQKVRDRSGRVVWAGGSDQRADGQVVGQI